MPFLRLTRDRRGFENTFLMHADRPGDRPRLLYWYRTAPGIMLGRVALDEDAIRTIEEQHPDIDFDWPAILALREVMTPEDEAPRAAPQPQRQRAPSAKPRSETPQSRSAAASRRSLARRGADDRVDEPSDAVGPTLTRTKQPTTWSSEAETPTHRNPAAAESAVDELAGREIATRLRARLCGDRRRGSTIWTSMAASREAWLARAEAIDPDAVDDAGSGARRRPQRRRAVREAPSRACRAVAKAEASLLARIARLDRIDLRERASCAARRR